MVIAPISRNVTSPLAVTYTLPVAALAARFAADIWIGLASAPMFTLALILTLPPAPASASRLVFVLVTEPVAALRAIAFPAPEVTPVTAVVWLNAILPSCVVSVTLPGALRLLLTVMSPAAMALPTLNVSVPALPMPVKLAEPTTVMLPA